jgi:hypothetical protein
LYEKSIGFRILHPMNWFDYCYSDQFCVGFDTMGGGMLKNCFCWWYFDRDTLHLALRSKHPFCGVIDTMVVGGAQHPDHPNQFMDMSHVDPSASIRDVVMVAPDGKSSRVC